MSATLVAPRLAEENERLRAALAAIVEGWPDEGPSKFADAQRIALAALAGEDWKDGIGGFAPEGLEAIS